MLLWHRRRRRRPSARLTRSGIRRRCYGEDRFVAFSAIASIRAYKLDLLTYDNIAFAFCDEAGDVLLAVAEDDDGWPDLLAWVEALPPDHPNWWSAVALPAFARNETVIWRRPAA